MRIFRIVTLATMCVIAFAASAFAGPTVGVPGPIAGAGIPGLIAAGVAAYAWYRRRK
jgi:hypothetical protein